MKTFEREYFLMLAFAVVLAVTQSGCGFYIGIDYQGRTEKSNTTETAGFRSAKYVKD